MPFTRLAGPLLLLALFAPHTAHAQSPTPEPVIHFIHGQWFDGAAFVPTDFYVESGVLTPHPSSLAHLRTVDLHNHFVVPPFGDAHEHNFDSLSNTPAVVAQYLRDGIFYAQGMTDVLAGSVAVSIAGLVNTPGTVDVTYAHGALTAVNGHPKEVYESLVNGFYYPATPAQRAIVLASHLRESQAYWEIDSPADLEEKWPFILAGRPDLIKVILSDSEHYNPDSHLHPVLGKGLDPALVPLIVARAHAAGLKVAAHIDTAHDFHVAVTAGVDELGHLPGYGLNAADDPATVHLTDSDIALCAAQHCRLQATAGIFVDDHTAPADLASRRRSQLDNLTRLKAAGIPILIGSDHYGQDSLHEAAYLQSLGLWSPLELLRMWSVTTPQAIFPKRRIGQLEPGFEASFLVLAANPLLDFNATHTILDRWKQGRQLPAPAVLSK